MNTVPNPQFSPRLLEAFTRAALEWAREHRPDLFDDSGRDRAEQINHQSERKAGPAEGDA